MIGKIGVRVSVELVANWPAVESIMSNSKAREEEEAVLNHGKAVLITSPDLNR